MVFENSDAVGHTYEYRGRAIKYCYEGHQLQKFIQIDISVPTEVIVYRDLEIEIIEAERIAIPKIIIIVIIIYAL